MELYRLTELFKEAIREYHESDNPSMELETTLDSLSLSLDEKLVNCCAFYKTMHAEAMAFKEESRRLEAEGEIRLKKAEAFKDYINRCLGGGGAPWKKDVHKISWRKSEAVEVSSIDELPVEFINYKEVANPDLKKIKEAIQAGTKVQGAKIIQRRNIQIK